MDYLVINDLNVKILFGEVMKGRGGNLLPTTVLCLGKGERGSRKKCE
jgi:hypothetical protein